MTPATNPQTTPSIRHDGWTPARRRKFLDALTAGLDVSRAVARVGLSRRSAYNLRQRETGFARAWDAARREARAADERAFVALLVERCEWARAVFPEAARESGFSLQDSVTSGPSV